MSASDRDRTGGHDSPDTSVPRYLCNEMSLEEQRAFEQEILESPLLAKRVYEETSLDATFEDAARAHRSRRTAAVERGRRAWFPLLLAAAALVVVFVIRGGGPDPGEMAPRLRSEDTGFRAISPRGDVAEESVHFAWTPDSLAVAYRIEVLDETGRLVFEAESADTTLTVPVASLGGSFRSGSWRVVPRDDLDLERPASPAVAFRIAGR